MASERGYRDKWLRYHKRYENKATTVFLKVFRSWSRSIDFDRLNVLNYSDVINNAINLEQLKEAYEKVYYDVGRLHGKRVGYAFNREVKGEKFFILGDFETSLQNFIRNYVDSWAFEYFKTVQQSYRDNIVKIIAEMVSNGESTEDITSRLRKLVMNRNFYRWQARRIARTEATAAANMGALQAGKISGFKTNKVWISSNDSRTRRMPEDKFDHFNMNGVQVDIDDFFKVPAKNMQGFEKMRYPGDRGGIGNATTSPGNTINCRCTVGIVAARDEDGNLIRDGENVIISPLNSPQGFKTIIEIEQKIKSLGINQVSLKGLKIDEANELLKVLQLENNLSTLSLNKINVIRKASARYAGIYSPSNNSITINLSHLRKSTQGTLKSFTDEIKKLKNNLQSWQNALDNPKYNQKKVKSTINRINRLINNYEQKIALGETPKYWTVSNMHKTYLERFNSVITHELGHYRHYKQIGINTYFRYNKNLSISEYGQINNREYLAEWYTFWRKFGDQNVPNDLLKIFKAL